MPCLVFMIYDFPLLLKYSSVWFNKCVFFVYASYWEWSVAFFFILDGNNHGFCMVQNGLFFEDIWDDSMIVEMVQVSENENPHVLSNSKNFENMQSMKYKNLFHYHKKLLATPCKWQLFPW